MGKYCSSIGVNSDARKLKQAKEKFVECREITVIQLGQQQILEMEGQARILKQAMIH